MLKQTKLQALFNDFREYAAFQDHDYNVNQSHIQAESFADALLFIHWDGLANQIAEQIQIHKPGDSISISGTWYTDNQWCKVTTFVGVLTENLKF